MPAYPVAVTTNEIVPIPRARPSEDGTELEVLTGFLDFLRATVVSKVAGLDDESIEALYKECLRSSSAEDVA